MEVSKLHCLQMQIHVCRCGKGLCQDLKVGYSPSALLCMRQSYADGGAGGKTELNERGLKFLLKAKKRRIHISTWEWKWLGRSIAASKGTDIGWQNHKNHDMLPVASNQLQSNKASHENQILVCSKVPGLNSWIGHIPGLFSCIG